MKNLKEYIGIGAVALATTACNTTPKVEVVLTPEQKIEAALDEIITSATTEADRTAAIAAANHIQEKISADMDAAAIQKMVDEELAKLKLSDALAKKVKEIVLARAKIMGTHVSKAITATKPEDVQTVNNNNVKFRADLERIINGKEPEEAEVKDILKQLQEAREAAEKAKADADKAAAKAKADADKAAKKAAAKKRRRLRV